MMASKSLFRLLSGQLTSRLVGIGEFVLFFGSLLRYSGMLIRRPMRWLRATYNAGVLSLPIVMLSGLFVGMVLALQAYLNMLMFGAQEATATLTALTLMRELGSVITALLFAGRAGSAITAEVGLMNVTEQLSAIEMMGIDPIAQVGVPRFYGALLSLPLLTIIFVAIAMVGAYFVAVLHFGLDGGMFWGQLQRDVGFYQNIFLGIVVKSTVFGCLCAAIAVFQGMICEPSAQGIGRATTKTVVYSSLAILAADFILTSVMFGM